MKKISLFLLFVAIFFSSCEPDLNRLLPSENTIWEAKRLTYELTWDFSLIESRIKDTAGTMSFLENGRGFWDNGKLRMKNEPILGDSFAWASNGNQIEILFDLEQEEIDQEDSRSFSFQVLENERSSQVWRHEEEFLVYNPNKRDSSDARLIWQWQLEKK